MTHPAAARRGIARRMCEHSLIMLDRVGIAQCSSTL
jgi:hypothetical protein